MADKGEGDTCMYEYEYYKVDLKPGNLGLTMMSGSRIKVPRPHTQHWRQPNTNTARKPPHTGTPSGFCRDFSPRPSHPIARAHRSLRPCTRPSSQNSSHLGSAIRSGTEPAAGQERHATPRHRRYQPLLYFIRAPHPPPRPAHPNPRILHRTQSLGVFSACSSPLRNFLRRAVSPR